jgi:predicted lysophospholipase L1 biosynthesis ABC-type transport system permease subunit
MAKKFWPNQDPIGKQFTIGTDPTHPMHVVGVAKDARYSGVSGAFAPYFYAPYLQHYQQHTLESLELRTAGDPSAMIPQVERTIRNMAPTLPVFDVHTLRQGLYSILGLLRFQVAATMAAIMGTLGLILAIVGVYGVLSYVVSQKTNEIGIRIALGAQPSDILKMVYRQGFRIVGIGLAFGLAASFAVAHLMRSFIVVSSTDPATYLGVSAILAAVALLACTIPARRAASIDPMQALRSE